MDYLQEHVINWIREQGGWVRSSWKSKSSFITRASAPDCLCDRYSLLCLLFVMFRRVFVPTLAHPHGRRLGSSWRVFLPLFLLFAKCEAFVRGGTRLMGGTTTEGNVYWNQKMKEQLKKKMERSYGWVNKLNSWYLDTKSYSLFLPPFCFPGLGVGLNALKLYLRSRCHWRSERYMMMCTKCGVESWSDLNRECILSNLFFTRYI